MGVWSGLLALLKAVVMPCFCLISGHLSPMEIDERRKRALCQLLATFLIFQALYYLNLMVSFRLNGFAFRAIPVQLFHPDAGQQVTWFLLALLIWRLAMPLVLSMRAPVTIALLLGLGALFVDLGVNYQNILSFFPYCAPRACARAQAAAALAPQPHAGRAVAVHSGSDPERPAMACHARIVVRPPAAPRPLSARRAFAARPSFSARAPAAAHSPSSRRPHDAHRDAQMLSASGCHARCGRRRSPRRASACHWRASSSPPPRCCSPSLHAAVMPLPTPSVASRSRTLASTARRQLRKPTSAAPCASWGHDSLSTPLPSR